jgi:tetratricopeptide (TPR) repeat protein
VRPERVERTLTVAGTPAYMAPELAANIPVSEASDWYALGVVLFEALTGRVPFEGGFLDVFWRKRDEDAPDVRTLAPEAPADLSELCARLLQRDPAARPSGVEVLQRLSGIEPSHHPVPPAELFIGREIHLRDLRRAYEQVRLGGTAVVHVRGRSGMGKSALCRKFLDDLSDDAVVLRGRCYESESVPFKALDPVIDALSQYLKNRQPLEAAALLPREKPLQALSRLFPTLLQVEPIAKVRGDAGKAESPRDLQNHAMDALKEILARIGERKPCIVHIDDLQWGDLDSVECLTRVLESADPPRVLFLFSFRSEDVPSTPHLQRLIATGGFLDLIVEPLSEVEAADLLRRSSGSEQVPEGAVSETGGMPLFTHELVQYARSGLNSAEQTRLSVEEMIRSRVRLLPPDARRMMEAVSVAARPIPTDVACTAAGVAGGGLSARIALSAAKLIRILGAEKEERIEPYHDKIREAVTATMPTATRQAYYESLAAVLETRADSDAEVLFQYFEAAGNLPKAEQWIEAAAGRAEQAFAFDLAVRLREKRLGLRPAAEAERAILLERLADALSSAGRGVDAAKVYQDAEQGAPEKRCELIRKAAEQYVRSGHFQEGQALLNGLLEQSGFPRTRGWRALPGLVVRQGFLRVRGLGFTERSPDQVTREEADRLDICRVASLAMALQDPTAAAALQSRHLLLALRLGEPYRIANSLAMEAGMLAARGGARYYTAARRLLDRAQEIAARSDHPNAHTLAISVGAKVAWFAGRWEEAVRYGEEANRLATEQYTRVAWEVYPSAMFWLCALACQGRWRTVIERLPALIKDGRARGDLLEVTNLPVLTFAYIRWLLSGEPQHAAGELDAAKEGLQETGFAMHRFGVWYGLTDTALYLGRRHEARQAVIEGWRDLEASMVLRVQSVRIMMLHLRARTACAVGDTNSARSDAARIRKEKTAWGNALSHFILASAAASENNRAEAISRFRQAEQGFLDTGMRQFRAAAAYRRAELSSGEEKQAARAIAEAWFESEGVKNPERIVAMICP